MNDSPRLKTVLALSLLSKGLFYIRAMVKTMSVYQGPNFSHLVFVVRKGTLSKLLTFDTSNVMCPKLFGSY